MKTERKPSIKQLSFSIILTALGVVLASFLWFPFFTTKCFPGQHLINALSGVLLGPVWALIISLLIGLIRMGLGVGTIYSIPGGVPGGLVVSFFYYLLKKTGTKHLEIAAFTEPIGTVLIGGTLTVYLFAPLIGDMRIIGALLPIWLAFAVSSIPGSILGFIVLEALKREKITRETFK